MKGFLKAGLIEFGANTFAVRANNPGGPQEPPWMARIVLGGALRIVATGSLLAPFSDTIFCWPFKCLPPRPRGITPS